MILEKRTRYFLAFFFLILSLAFLLIRLESTENETLDKPVSAAEERQYPSWMDEIIDPPPGVSPNKVYTFLCELPLRKSDMFTTACADFGEMIRDIKWDTWSAEGAEGTGIYSVNDCEPDCASGTRHELPVRVWLEDTTTDGEYYYLNTLKIVPIATIEKTDDATVTKYFNVNNLVEIDGMNFEGAIWDVSSDWKNFPNMRSELPSEKKQK